MKLSIQDKFFRAGLEKQYIICGNDVIFTYEGIEYRLAIKDSGFTKKELERSLNYLIFNDFSNQVGYKFSKSSSDMEQYCYERRKYVKHEVGKCVENDNLEHLGLSFLLGTENVFLYMLKCYGDLLTIISFDKKHPEAYKMENVKIYYRALNEYVAEKYLVEKVLDLRDPSTIEYIFNICDKNEIEAGIYVCNKFKQFLKVIGANEALQKFESLAAMYLINSNK